MNFCIRFFLQLIDIRLFLVSVIGVGTLSILLGPVASLLLLFLFLILNISLLANLNNSLDLLNSLSTSISVFFRRFFTISSLILALTSLTTLGVALLSGFTWNDFSFGGVVDTLIGYFWILSLLSFLFVSDRSNAQIGARRSLKSLPEIFMIFGWPLGFVVIALAFILSPLLAYILTSTSMWVTGWIQQNLYFRRLSLNLQKQKLFAGIGAYFVIGGIGAALSLAFGQGTLLLNRPIGMGLFKKLMGTEVIVRSSEIKDARDLAKWIAQNFPDGKPKFDESLKAEEILAGLVKIEELCEPGYPVGFIGYICRGKSIPRTITHLKISMSSRDERFGRFMDSSGLIAKIVAYTEIAGLSEVGINPIFLDFKTKMENDGNLVIRGFVGKLALIDLRKRIDTGNRGDNDFLILFYPSKD